MAHNRNIPQVSRFSEALAVARDLGTFRARDFVQRGYSREYIRRLLDREEVIQLRRGLYAFSGFQGNEHQTLVEAAKRIPAGVICLLSALNYHKIGTQAPAKVWMALPRNKNYPSINDLPVRLFRYSLKSHAAGIEEHHLPGGIVKIYSPAKTIADCFKFRSKIGIDVCIEALDDCLRHKRTTVSEINRFAAICRVSRVIQPYLEAMI